jgi:glycosyltransferase involved in cell wall biosynthesis
MRQLIFVNRYYRPDHSATSQLLTDLAEYLAAEGNGVTVLCSRQLYDDPKANLARDERMAGVDVRRISTTRFGRSGLGGRAIDYLSFYFAAFLWLLRHVHKNDTVVAKTDPPLISFVVACVVRVKRAKLINWLQDLFPEVAWALGMRMPAPAKSLALMCRNYSLRVADVNVAIGQGMAERLRQIPGARVAKIDNWAPGTYIRPVERNNNPLRRAWELEDRFVVGYSGNFGRAHDFRTLLDAATLLAQAPHIRFLLIGAGAQRRELEEYVEKAGLTNVVLKPYQPRDLLAQSLSAADVHIVTLQPELEGLIVPSKFYSILDTGRPIIFIGSPSGEIANLLAQHRCGVTVAPGDAESLKIHIERLAANPAMVTTLGSSALTAARALSRQTALSAWSRLTLQTAG